MQIIQELRAGTVHFQLGVNGEEQFSTRPPTALNLKASRAIEELVQVIQGLERANQTLQIQIQQTESELNAQRSLVQKLLADAQQPSSGAVPANTEAAEPKGAAGVETEAGPTPGST